MQHCQVTVASGGQPSPSLRGQLAQVLGSRVSCHANHTAVHSIVTYCHSLSHVVTVCHTATRSATASRRVTPSIAHLVEALDLSLRRDPAGALGQPEDVGVHGHIRTLHVEEEHAADGLGTDPIEPGRRVWG